MLFYQKAVSVFVVSFALVVSLSLSGCSDPEASARKLYNEAMTLQREGQAGEALVKYKQLVEKYPETQTAVEANKVLLEFKATAKILRPALEGALQVMAIDTGRFPTTKEGLQALVEKPASLKGWHGPYLRVKISETPQEVVKRYTDLFEYQGPDSGGLTEGFSLIEKP